MPSEAAARVFTVATRLFGERGYPATSMRDISDAIGILPGSLYAHISSKEDLLLQIVTSGIDKYLEAIAPVATSKEPAPDRLRAAIRAHVRVAAENGEQTLVAFQQWKYLSDEKREVVVAKRAEYGDHFRRIVEDGVKKKQFRITEPRLAVLGIVGLLNWVPEWFSPAGPKSVDEVADALADLVLSGVTGGAMG